jgi:hypothetical protein
MDGFIAILDLVQYRLEGEQPYCPYSCVPHLHGNRYSDFGYPHKAGQIERNFKAFWILVSRLKLVARLSAAESWFIRNTCFTTRSSNLYCSIATKAIREKTGFSEGDAKAGTGKIFN